MRGGTHIRPLDAPFSPRLDAEVPDPEPHLEFAARQLADPAVAPWHGGPRGRQEVRRWLADQARQAAADGFCLWWWRERATGELVGYAGLNRAEVEGEPVVELGWSIAPRRWGQGLATEAAWASVAWGFERVGLDEIVAFTLIDNARSRAVMEKLGMQWVGEFKRRDLLHILYRVGAASD